MEKMKNLLLTTEKRNPNSLNIDRLSTLEMLEIMNQEDQKVAEAVSKILPQIAEATDLTAERFLRQGRLIYVGAGTSGRLGLLDSVELTPTYSVPSTRAFALLAGGKDALFESVEGAEDSEELALKDVKEANITENDIMIGLSASGRTPYVLAALKYANEKGALTLSIACNESSELSKVARVAMDVEVGPEVITGSTRMKAGTAQKMILNMLSSSIMVKTGKVYQNLMINVQATNEKLITRGIRIVSEATLISLEEAREVFEKSGHQVNLSILMIELKISKEEAEELLEKSDGNIAHIITEKDENPS
ncbi:MAG: N-acetylmuramic acid 6-phosphate etherase [Lactovum sp.]